MASDTPLARLLRALRPERRSLSYQNVWGSGRAWSGSSGEMALRTAPVWAATALIADALASTPWHVYERRAGTPRRVDSPELFTTPGVGIDLYTWKHQLAASVLLRGNSYGLITERDGSFIPSRVVWLNPEEIDVDETGVVPEYRHRGKHISRADVIHLRGYTLPGSFVGLSPVAQFRTATETSIAAQDAQKRYFERNGIPTAQLKNTKKTIDDATANRVKDRFQLAVEGGEVFVTGEDWEYKSFGLARNDIEFLSAMKATATQIAAIYRVSPEEIGGETGGSSLTYRNLEQDQIRFQSRTLQPWCTRIETALSAYLTGDTYLRFNLAASVRADVRSRYAAHKTALDAGFLTLDEVRALEELPPLAKETDTGRGADTVSAPGGILPRTAS